MAGKRKSAAADVESAAADLFEGLEIPEYPTMGILEACEAMKANLVLPLSAKTLGLLMMEGKIPGAYACIPEGAQARYLIFKHAFYKWLGEMIGKEPVRVQAEDDAEEDDEDED